MMQTINSTTFANPFNNSKLVISPAPPPQNGTREAGRIIFLLNRRTASYIFLLVKFDGSIQNGNGGSVEAGFAVRINSIPSSII
jgi:hypothetical protein